MWADLQAVEPPPAVSGVQIKERLFLRCLQAGEVENVLALSVG
jgi:hypothetical protein